MNCDTYQLAERAITCGYCKALSSNTGTIPAGCLINGKTPPSSICALPNIANNNYNIFKNKYSPKNLIMSTQNMKILQSEQNAYGTSNATNLSNINKDLGISATNFTWSEAAQSCKIPRENLLMMNMSINPLIGGDFMYGKIWKHYNSPLPVVCDYFMNPDLLTIIIVMIVVIFVLKKYIVKISKFIHQSQFSI